MVTSIASIENFKLVFVGQEIPDYYGGSRPEWRDMFALYRGEGTPVLEEISFYHPEVENWKYVVVGVDVIWQSQADFITTTGDPESITVGPYILRNMFRLSPKAIEFLRSQVFEVDGRVLNFEIPDHVMVSYS